MHFSMGYLWGTHFPRPHFFSGVLLEFVKNFKHFIMYAIFINPVNKIFVYFYAFISKDSFKHNYLLAFCADNTQLCTYWSYLSLQRIPLKEYPCWRTHGVCQWLDWLWFLEHTKAQSATWKTCFRQRRRRRCRCALDNEGDLCFDLSPLLGGFLWVGLVPQRVPPEGGVKQHQQTEERWWVMFLIASFISYIHVNK